jgi:hypothetical protein
MDATSYLNVRVLASSHSHSSGFWVLADTKVVDWMVETCCDGCMSVETEDYLRAEAIILWSSGG